MDPLYAANKLFAFVPPGQRATIDFPIEDRQLAAHEILFEEGDPGDGICLVAEGTLEISKAGDSRLVLTHIPAGDFLGEVTLFDASPRTARATASGPARIGRIARETLEDVVRDHPQVYASITQVAFQRLRDADERLLENILRTERLSLVGTMVGTIVHDFKNPLAAILGVSEFLQNRKDDAKLTTIGKVARKSVDHMMDMTKEILDFVRGTSEVKLKKGDIGELIGELNILILDALRATGITVEEDFGYTGPFVADYGRLTRLLVNVMKNAGEAMPGGGTLTVSIHKPDNLVIRISDTGCGMPPEVKDRIFEPFVTHGKKGGTGLGMAIAKSVIDAHNGTIAVESEEGKGTTFHITLPTAAPAES